MKKNICIRQRDITDCGAACLASIAANYRLHMPVSRIRQIAGTDTKGTNVIGLIEAAEKMGMHARGARGNSESLHQIPLPAIAHLVIDNKWHHYVVLYKIRGNTVRYMDPATGTMIKKSKTEFLDVWSGVIVLMSPGTDFKPGRFTKSASLRFWQLVRPHKMMMLQALIGAIVFTLLGLTSSVYVQKIVDHVLVDGNLRLLNLLSVVMVVLLIFQFVLGSLKSLFALRTGQQIDSGLILGYYRHLLQMPQQFFDTMRVGEIISRVNDAVKIRTFVNDIALSLIVNFLIIAFSMMMMFMYYWKLALIMLLIIPVYFGLYRLSNYFSSRQQRELMESGAALETQLVESLTAAGTIKKFTLEGFAGAKTEMLFGNLLKAISKAGTTSIYINNSTDSITRIFTIILLWFGSYFVINRELSPGELLSFYALIGYLTSPAAALIGANRNIQDALIAADRLYEIIDLETETHADGDARVIIQNQGEIIFEAIDFRYGTRSKVFDQLNIRFAAGSSTAIVGESGSGKSTLAALLLRLYEPSSGKITMGGLDIKLIDRHHLRKFISMVPQQIDLFADSIIANIALGVSEPDLGKIIGLCRMLGISSFIESLPMHYQTVLNENGLNLSGGQRQRIAIARALYRDPEILILDEATSSLDPVSEKHVQAALDWFLAKGKTVIIIAHRLTTIKNCDTIHVLENGRLIETGNHRELIAGAGTYSRLWQQPDPTGNG